MPIDEDLILRAAARIERLAETERQQPTGRRLATLLSKLLAWAMVPLQVFTALADASCRFSIQRLSKDRRNRGYLYKLPTLKTEEISSSVQFYTDSYC